MAATSPPPKGPKSTVPFLNGAIESLNLAEISNIAPAKDVFASAGVLLGTIKDSMVNEQDYVELGLSCADVCQALDRGLKVGRASDLSESMLGAIEKLTATVSAIQKKIIKQGKQNPISCLLHARSNKHAIAAWGRDLDRILHIFNTELSMNNHMILLELYRNALAGQEPATKDICQPIQQSSPLGELPPPPPRACFGRDDLIEKIIGFADTLNPVALVGAGGIGKTSIALKVLHDHRIKKGFGDERRFIRCDRFLPSRKNFLSQLSKAIGAGIDNPEDLSSLRPTLSSRKMMIILDNAESSLDPQGADGKEIYQIVEELSRFPNIHLIITSRIYTVPSDCETLAIPPLSMEAACETFYRIYRSSGQSDPVNDILKQLEFHPLSVTLLATVAYENGWDNIRLSREWAQRQTNVLQTGHGSSLAATIELSLSSPTSKALGPDARGLLEIIAFFPQGVDENNLDWLFPTISNRSAIFDMFCALSLTYRSKGFVTMLAPLRDHLQPKDPMQSPLLCKTKELYLIRLSVEVDPRIPGFKDGGWIVSEDVNVEHLLDVFTSLDADLADNWDACAGFLKHLYWKKPRQTVLGSKVERLPDHHPSKPQCLLWLSWMFCSLGNYVEQKRVSTYALALAKEEGNDNGVAEALGSLSDANRMMGLYEEAIQQMREAFGIWERLGDRVEQADSLVGAGRLLTEMKDLDAAEQAIFRAVDLLPENGQEFLLCQSHHFLGRVYHSKGERGKAIHHFEEALQIAARFNWDFQSFWIHYSLSQLLLNEGKLDHAHDRIQQTKLHARSDTYCLGRAAEMHARIWYRQDRFAEAMSEASRASEIYERLGAANDLERCRASLRNIELKARSREARPPPVLISFSGRARTITSFRAPP